MKIYSNNLKTSIFLVTLAVTVGMGTAAFARDLRFVEYAQYGENAPDSLIPTIVEQSDWIMPIADPENEEMSFLTKGILYLDQGISDALAPHPAAHFQLLIRQDLTEVEQHPGINGAPLLVCMYAPMGENWAQTRGLDEGERVALVADHAAEITTNLFWDIIDHPQYHDIPDHPLGRIGAFRASCPGEATGAGKELIEDIRTGLSLIAFERTYENIAPFRDIRKGTPNFRLEFAAEAGLAVIKPAPRITTTPGAAPNPLADPPPFFLRFVPMRVQYQSPGSTGLFAMDFYPLQNLLTDRFTGLPGSLTDQVDPMDVVAARSQNNQQQYQICRYSQQRNVAYWVWSTPFELTSRSNRIEPSTASPQRPVFTCPLDPPNPW